MIEMLTLNNPLISNEHTPLIHQQKINVVQAIIIIKRMAHTWNRRAQIRQFDFGEDIVFEDEADDFLFDLLPFKDHPAFLRASEAMKSKVLSCGWIIYNQKTLLIETEIINQACSIISRVRAH